MEVNVWSVVVATIAMFVVGAIWYMGPFAKAWGEIHGFNKISKAKQKQMQAKMGPFYLAQILVTVLSAWVLAVFIALLPDQSPYSLALMIWLGFVLPPQVSGVIFGGTEPKFVIRKIAIMAGEALLHLEVAAFVISMM